MLEFNEAQRATTLIDAERPGGVSYIAAILPRFQRQRRNYAIGNWREPPGVVHTAQISAKQTASVLARGLFPPEPGAGNGNIDNSPDAGRTTGLKNQLAQYWLFTLCRLIDGVAGGAVFAHNAGGEDLAAIAQWPDPDAVGPQFAALAEACLNEDRSRLVQERGESGGQLFDLLACPLAPAGRESAAVVLRLSSRVPSRQQAALRRVVDAAAWFAALDTQRSTAGRTSW